MIKNTNYIIFKGESQMIKKEINVKRAILKLITSIMVLGLCFMAISTSLYAETVEGLSIQLTGNWPGTEGIGVYRLYNSPDSVDANVSSKVDVNNWNGEVTYKVVGQTNNFEMVEIESTKFGRKWIYIGDGNGCKNGKGYNFIKSGPGVPMNVPALPKPVENKPVENKSSISPTGWMWPAPNCRLITSNFGLRDGSFHDGIDISKSGNSNGEGIIASRGGTVIMSSFSMTAGNWIVIDHGDGLSSVYMHCSSREVNVGAHVEQGQTIGKIGNTGTSTGAHLHFTICKTSSALNPPRTAYNPLNYVSQLN